MSAPATLSHAYCICQSSLQMHVEHKEVVQIFDVLRLMPARNIVA